MNPNYSINKHSDIQVIEVTNLLNEFANKEILQAAQSKIDEGFNKFVVDLKQIQFMNSVGLNFLISLRARSNEKGGQVVVANASRKVMQLLEMTKLRPMFSLNDSVESALEQLANGNGA